VLVNITQLPSFVNVICGIFFSFLVWLLFYVFFVAYQNIANYIIVGNVSAVFHPAGSLEIERQTLKLAFFVEDHNLIAGCGRNDFYIPLHYVLQLLV
jgi:hypothetical protein